MPKYDGCKGKIRHRTLLAAQVAQKKTKNAQVQVYRCGVCKSFHVGRSRSPALKEKRLDQIFKRIHREDELRRQTSR